MKKTIQFLLVFFFTYSLTSGKNLKSINSYPEFQGKVDFLNQSSCNQQLVHRESNLWLTITNWGIIGSEAGSLDDSETGLSAPSGEFPGGFSINYLFMGAIWVGGVVEGETLVSVGADGWFLNYEISPDICPGGEIKKVEELGDQEFVAAFTDTVKSAFEPDPFDRRPHKPLKIKITQHSYSWIDPPYNDFVILDYKIENIGDKLISKAYIGFYMDTDIYHLSSSTGWLDDITGYVEKTFELQEGTRKIDLAWAADNNGDLVDGKITSASPIGVLGFKLLGSSNPELKISYNWWISDIDYPEDLNFGPWKKSNWENWIKNYDIWGEGGKGTPCGDKAKYFLMSNGEYDYDQVYTCVDQSDVGWLPPPSSCADLADGYDTRFLYSFGPFDIPAKDSISFSLGVIMGDSLHRGENILDCANPDSYYAKLSFNDLLFNAFVVQRVYESGYTLPPPGPPQDFKILSFSDSSLLLSWSPKRQIDVIGYNVYRRSFSNDNPASLLNSGVIQDTFYSDRGLVEGDTYYYTIASVDVRGEAGKRSQELVFTAGKPSTPVGLKALADKEKICLTWKSNSEEDIMGYKIYRKTEGGKYDFINGVGLAGLDTSFCDRKIENGIVYYYAVSAIDSMGIESWLSDSVCALSMAFDQGILLVDMSSPAGRVHVQDDSVSAFYNRAFKDYPFVYSKHDLPDIEYLSLKELSPYSVCLVHSEGRYGPSSDEFDSTLVNLRHYLSAGGKLILAGRHIIQPSSRDSLKPFKQGDFAYDILHIDSMQFPSWSCNKEEFIGTRSVFLPEFLDLEVDAGRVNRSYPRSGCDLQGKLPLIGYFVPLYPEEVIYSFNSAYDSSSFEAKAIGMRHIGEDYRVYFFDFPLYYIKEEQSIPLLHKILAEFGFSPTEAGEELVSIPEGISLGRNFPNPFNPTTTIPFTVNGSEFIVHSPVRTTLKIYNILGQLVRTLVDGEQLPGNYRIIWDGKDNSGKEVSSGIYFYHLRTQDYNFAKKMVLLR